jgi:hypothetical protein
MKLRTLCLLLFLPVATTFVGAQIPATDDSFTTSSSPTSNYGTQSSLEVIVPGQQLHPLRPYTAVGRIDQLQCQQNHSAAEHQRRDHFGHLRRVRGLKAWMEGTITYSNAPPLGTKVSSGVMIPTSKRNFIDVDVTQAVQDWLGGTQANYGIALVQAPAV